MWWEFIPVVQNQNAFCFQPAYQILKTESLMEPLKLNKDITNWKKKNLFAYSFRGQDLSSFCICFIHPALCPDKMLSIPFSVFLLLSKLHPLLFVTINSFLPWSFQSHMS